MFLQARNRFVRIYSRLSLIRFGGGGKQTVCLSILFSCTVFFQLAARLALKRRKENCIRSSARNEFPSETTSERNCYMYYISNSENTIHSSFLLRDTKERRSLASCLLRRIRRHFYERKRFYESARARVHALLVYRALYLLPSRKRC